MILGVCARGSAASVGRTWSSPDISASGWFLSAQTVQPWSAPCSAWNMVGVAVTAIRATARAHIQVLTMGILIVAGTRGSWQEVTPSRPKRPGDPPPPRPDLPPLAASQRTKTCVDPPCTCLAMMLGHRSVTTTDESPSLRTSRRRLDDGCCRGCAGTERIQACQDHTTTRSQPSLRRPRT